MAQARQIRALAFGAIGAVGLSVAGCATFSSKLPPLPADAVRPVVAVTEFENETGFAGQWKLGRGMADLLVAELLDTERMIVVDRKHLNDIVGEINRQGQGLFRKEDTVEKGRLKNARFLVRGVITDFTQTGSASGWFRSSGGKNGAGLKGARAVVMLHLTITDVETGEILFSVPGDGTAKASGKWAQFDYRNVSFGGDLFFQTPVGKATQEAIRKAVLQIARALPYATWTPRVAEAGPDGVIINGGENTGVKAGDCFDVRLESRPITDPETGDVIERLPGKTVGRIQITRVKTTSADGTLLSGEAKRGQYLEKVK